MEHAIKMGGFIVQQTANMRDALGWEVIEHSGCAGWDYIEHSRPHNRRDVPGREDIEHSRQHNKRDVPRLGGIYEIVFMMRAPNCRLLKWLKIASRKLQG
jgi:hypothetical protein